MEILPLPVRGSGQKDIWWGNIVAAAEIATAPVGLRNDVKRYFSGMVKAGKAQYEKGIIYKAGTEIATAFTKSCNDKKGMEILLLPVRGEAERHMVGKYSRCRGDCHSPGGASQ